MATPAATITMTVREADRLKTIQAVVDRMAHHHTKPHPKPRRAVAGGAHAAHRGTALRAAHSSLAGRAQPALKGPK